MIQPSNGQIKRNILFGLVGQGAVLVISLVATRLIFRELGAEVLGVISFSVTLTFLLISLSDMGSSLVVTREIAAHHGIDEGYVEDLIGSVSALAWMAFFVSALIVLVTARLMVDKWFHFETMPAKDVALALQVISVSLLVAIPRTMYGAIVAGFGRMDAWNIANVWSMGIQQLGMIAVLMLGGGLSHVAMWYAISAILGLVPIVFSVWKLAGIKAMLPAIHTKTISRNLHFGMQMFGTSIASYLVTQADRWVISKYLPLAHLGYYGFIQGLVSKGGIVPSAIAAAAFPALSSTFERSENQAWMKQYHKLQDLTCYVYLPITAGVAMLGIVVTGFVFNGEIVQSLWLPLIFLSVGQYLLGVMSVPYWLAIAMKNPGMSLRSNLWSLVLVLPILVWLTYKYGLVGAAFSSILYGAWQLIYFVPRFCAQCLRVDPWSWYSRVGRFTILGFLIYGTSWVILWQTGYGLSALGLLPAYTIGTMLFLVAGWFVAGKNYETFCAKSLKGWPVGREKVFMVGAQNDSVITTVIPTFRRPQLLRRAVYSALRQTYPHVRVMVCDNASGDETAEVVGEIMREDPRVTYWCHPANIGSYRNFNFGIQSVETPFFSLLSDDDLLAPHFYEAGLRAFACYPNAMFVDTNSIVMDTSNQVISGPVGPKTMTFYEAGEGFFDMAAVRIPNTWTGMLFRTAARDDIGLVDLDAGAFADGGFVLHAAARFSFVVVPEICAVLMAHANSTSGTIGVANKAWRDWAERMIRRIEADMSVPEAVRRGARAVMMPDIARIGFDQFLKALVGGDAARARALLISLDQGVASRSQIWKMKLLFALRDSWLFQVLVHRVNNLRHTRLNNRYHKLTQKFRNDISFIHMLEKESLTRE